MASKRILIVDDEENIGRSLKLILEREGYAVSVCRSIAEFRAQSRSRPCRCLPARCAPSRRQRDRPAALPPAGAQSRAGRHDFRPRHHRRRRRGHARRRLRFSRKAPQPRPRAAGPQECPGAGQPAPGKRAPAGTGGHHAPHDRVQPGLPARRGAGHHGRPLGCARPPHRRIGDRQGTARRAHPPAQPLRLRPLRQGELRRHPHRTPRKRAVRPRERRLHRRRRRAPRQVRARRRRHDLSRRGRRSPRRFTSQAAARPAGGRVPARGRRADHSRRRARGLCHQPRPRPPWSRKQSSAKIFTTA